jgi:FixJ family two-component response regulator
MDETRHTATIHVVEDDPPFREALARLLHAAGHEVRTYGSTGEFLLHDIEDAPGCLLLDFQLPGPNGLELQEALAQRGARLPVVFLSGRGDIPVAVRAMKAGAVDFLTKPVRRAELLEAVRKALERCREERAHAEVLESRRARYARLTPREIEVFERVASGKLNKVIATELGIAERTVKLHRAHVMEKMGAHSLAELVHIADQLRPDSPPPNVPPSLLQVRIHRA